MKSKAFVLKTKYQDRSSVWPSNLLRHQSHLACPSQNPATPLLWLTCKVSFYCRVNSYNQTEHPCLVQLEQKALQPGLSGSCTEAELTVEKTPYPKTATSTHNFFLLLPINLIPELFAHLSVIQAVPKKSRLWRAPSSPSEALLPPSLTNNQKNKWKSINKENS